jgi:hypothetical protein
MSNVTSIKKTVWPIADHCNAASIELDHAHGMLDVLDTFLQTDESAVLMAGSLQSALHAVLVNVERARELINSKAVQS